MADDKNPITSPPAAPAEDKTAKGPKTYTYVGPKPAPLISNLPNDLQQPRLGYKAERIPADKLFEQLGAACVEYVRRTNKVAKDFWK